MILEALPKVIPQHSARSKSRAQSGVVQTVIPPFSPSEIVFFLLTRGEIEVETDRDRETERGVSSLVFIHLPVISFLYNCILGNVVYNGKVSRITQISTTPSPRVSTSLLPLLQCLTQPNDHPKLTTEDQLLVPVAFEYLLYSSFASS